VINKSGKNDAIITDFCHKVKIPVLARLPLSREIAETYAAGKLLVKAKPQYTPIFQQLYERIQNIVKVSA
jgi:MinD superfamily P-loop ATPase